MRVNIYSQELTNQIDRVEKQSDTGLTYSAIRLFLHSSDKLHYTATDDDRSAITFWLPKSEERRETLAQTFERMATIVRTSRSETGCD